MTLSIQPPGAAIQRAPRGHPLLALGFRPFFLCAGAAGLVLMGLWLGHWQGLPLVPGAYWDPVAWHAHEMLFGYAVAVIAGFLLTAVRNWTGLGTPSGAPLALLVLLWLAGRGAPLIGPAVPWLAAALDLAFLPALAASLARPLWRGANRANRGFLLVLLAMAAANALMHAGALGLWPAGARLGQGFMLDLVLLLILIIAGRVMPFFTRMALPGDEPRVRPWLERAGLLLMILFAATHLVLLPAWPGALLAALLAGAQGLRLWGWYRPGVWRIPILAVLYAGYAWLVIGFGLYALAGVAPVPVGAALHAMTVGAIAVITVGMMARVSLGHTGRPMHTTAAVNLAFLALNLAAALRVFGPILAPTQYAWWVQASGALWLAAFVLFLAYYAPVLWSPRADGRPG